jgi:hypothetical protein
MKNTDIRLFERLEVRFICIFGSISLLLDPDPHSQNGSLSRRAKSNRIHVDPDPQHWPEDLNGFFSYILPYSMVSKTGRYFVPNSWERSSEY